MTVPTLSVTTTPTSAMESDRTVDLALAGQFDANAALTLREQIAEASAAGPVLVLVDVSAITGVSPSGVAAILDLLRHVRGRGGDVRLYGESPAFHQAYTALRLDSITRVYRTRRQAAHQEISTSAGRDARVRHAPRHRRPVTDRVGWRGRFGRRPPLVASN